jgi:predicted HicB family RNase H-like nuclease
VQPRKSRNVRVEDELWEAALAAAEDQNRKLSEEIRRFLEDYVRAHEKRKGKR